jgi:hypothetical protein
VDLRLADSPKLGEAASSSAITAVKLERDVDTATDGPNTGVQPRSNGLKTEHDCIEAKKTLPGHSSHVGGVHAVQISHSSYAFNEKKVTGSMSDKRSISVKGKAKVQEGSGGTTEEVRSARCVPPQVSRLKVLML